MKEHPTAQGEDVGRMINREYSRDWSTRSEISIGNVIREWAAWLLMKGEDQTIPTPPGYTGKAMGEQPKLFDF